jgi:hypothetical protein
MVVAMLVGMSMALSAGALSLGDDEVSMEWPTMLRSLEILGMREFSFEGGGQEFYWPKLEVNWRVALTVILGMLGCSLCSIGGVGGSELFIPLFNLLIGFDAKSATALSNFMILGGALANVGWNIQ